MANTTAHAAANNHKNDDNIIHTSEHRVACDGGGTHPKTYYDLGKWGEATCHYCGQKFAAAH